ncbi:MAG: hypothetical protein E7Z90_04960 [Cyanobacteria bacterium SIG29]|nr:hypothetical protein [Cyanobacteria bacterium SIG29]
MKKILIAILILIIQTSFAFATTTTIEAIENNLFGYDYNGETDTKRIERIENFLYGKKQTGTIEKRLKKIKNDTGVSINKTINKKENLPQNDASILKEDSTVEYPIVDKMEKELFNECYKTENIYKRLDRLEQKVFNKTFSEDLNTRVDKLEKIILPKKQITRATDDYTNQEIDNYYRKNGLESIDNQSFPFRLAVLEQDLLNNTYENENTAIRLSRLEEKLFKKTFTNDSDISRLQRLIVAYDAKQKSYKYENNRKMQNMATASQLGGILLMILAMIL